MINIHKYYLNLLIRMKWIGIGVMINFTEGRTNGKIENKCKKCGEIHDKFLEIFAI